MGYRAAISSATSRGLWVRAAGRCEYRGCNRYLLEDELTGFELNLAEQAHVVGATEGDGSPRGDNTLDLAKRALEANLMLLCRDHHRVIDRLIAEHGVEGLMEMKREHEERIRMLTGLSAEAKTVVIRAIGGIRGGPVEVPRREVQSAVLADGRYPDYRAALAGEDLEIDLRRLPAEGDSDYWRVGERMIAESAARLGDAQEPIPHLSVFALSRIPFLVALGYHLDDKVPATIYPRRRGGTGDGGWGFDPDAAATGFQMDRRREADESRVALAVSLTAPIGSDVLDASLGSFVYEIEPEGAGYSRELFSARGSLHAFAETYHRFLSLVERDHPECHEIDVYLAAPAPAAVQVGRGLMREAQPKIAVFDRGRDRKFEQTLVLGG